MNRAKIVRDNLFQIITREKAFTIFCHRIFDVYALDADGCQYFKIEQGYDIDTYLSDENCDYELAILVCNIKVSTEINIM